MREEWHYNTRTAAVSHYFTGVHSNQDLLLCVKIGLHAIYFFEMSDLFEAGELNTYVYDSGGPYRRKYV